MLTVLHDHAIKSELFLVRIATKALDTQMGISRGLFFLFSVLLEMKDESIY